jgi:hypothetical protein
LALQVVLCVLILPSYAPFRLHVTTVHILHGQKEKKNKTMGEGEGREGSSEPFREVFV